MTNIPEDLSERLSGVLNEMIWKLDGGKILSFADKIRLNNILKEFLVSSVSKFIQGQKEHGGKLIERDLDRDISEELIDLFWYHSFNKLKK